MADKTTTKVPAMTRQHFAYIASVIASLPVSEDDRANVIVRFSHELSATNARFDRDRFISACYDS